MLTKSLSLRKAGTVVAMVVTALALSVEATLAHAGHAHGDKGFDTESLLQLAGAVVLIGIAYLAASRYYQYRDRTQGVHDQHGPE
jgi:hypothetical protein